MRCAGLVACANRKNRQPVPGIGTHREAERRDYHRREDVSGPCVGRAPRAASARQHQADLIGTHDRGRGRVCRKAAMRWTVSDGAKMQRNRAGSKDNISRVIRRRNGIQSATMERSTAPAGRGAAPGVHRADRGPPASRNHRQVGRNRSRRGTGVKAFRCESVVVR